MIFQRVHRRANLLFSVHGLAEQVGHSLTGKYPTGVFSDSARLPLMLALRCGSILYGTTAVQYRLSAVWALSAAVRPAFAVLICAPGLGFSGFRLPSFIVEVLRWVRG